MCTAPCPLLVTVAESELLLPTPTLPNVNDEGFKVKCPTGAAAAVPDSPIVAGDAGSLLVMAILPVSVPAAVGAKITLKVADWPALITLGVAMPETLNC